jgi:hypothetical protein
MVNVFLDNFASHLLILAFNDDGILPYFNYCTVTARQLPSDDLCLFSLLQPYSGDDILALLIVLELFDQVAFI